MGQTSEQLDAWIKRLSEETLPVLAHTAKEISRLAQSDQSSLAQLARLILQDASMTAHVLRLANSGYYSGAAGKVNTVSRAVVLLGFDEIRSICLTIATIDEMLSGKPRQRLVEGMACSFHAAVIARALAELTGDPAPEEVFVAALLFKLGELAFWSSGGALADMLEQELKDATQSQLRAEAKVLGFHLSQLTAGLAREWRLGELLLGALHGIKNEDKRGANIILAHLFAREVSFGWEKLSVDDAIEALALHAGRAEPEMRTVLEHATKRAKELARTYGARVLSLHIVLPKERSEPQSTAAQEDLRSRPIVYENNPALQLTILRELAHLLEGNPESWTVMDMVLEGLYRGVGLDRAVCALVTPDRRRIQAKSVIGSDRLYLMRFFDFEIGSARATVFQYVLDEKKPLWLSQQVLSANQKLMTKVISRIIGEGPFFLAPIIVGGQSIGVFYADRRVSDRPLDEESFEGFKHFVLAAGQAVELLNDREK